ncbi:hypothetical protein GQ43DRAFT_458249 [Delitschia confertaspora ATCC 74209]|uniref:BZIP domain-containing protein n=1 Tax=Delitschia confertaspora ATCC 74209 TaxID=1513339 RepID=A0A9P4JE96_9PLEO|nr:hypothetical protein GQ43DRAFT_458249 [Delitschia confertaspora ATCC 74209]
MSSSIPSGPRKTRTRVSHEHTLERVRENQRRHRARRRDHIATLEQKLQEAERQLAEARADIEALKRERDGGTSDSELLTNLPSPLMSVYSPTVSVPNSPSPTLGATNGPIHTAAATCQPLCCETEKEEERTMSNVTASSLDCDCPSTALPPSNPSESTTLCSQAYILIAQQNYRGIEGDTIRRWLWEGFRAGQGRGEGCRVENGALFSLLDFISGV